MRAQTSVFTLRLATTLSAQQKPIENTPATVAPGAYRTAENPERIDTKLSTNTIPD